MTTESMRQEIIKAVESKEYSRTELDRPSNKGNTVGKLVSGKPVRKETIEQVYARLIELRTGKQETPAQNEQETPAQNEQATEPEKVVTECKQEDATKKGKSSMQTQLATMQATMKEQAKMIAELKEQFNAMSVAGSNKPQCNKVGDTQLKESSLFLGYHIKLENQVTKITLASGEIKTLYYPKYFAKKKVAGKLHRIYIGEHAFASEARAKIEAYCDKHGLILKEE